jgi:hypothetical protein
MKTLDPISHDHGDNTKQALDEIGETVNQALNSYRCARTVDAEGDGLHLVDKLSAPGETIETGRTEIAFLTDHIYNKIDLVIRRALEDKGEREQWYDDLVDDLDEVLDAPDCTGKGCDSYGHDEDCEISDVGKHARRYVGELKTALEAQRVLEDWIRELEAVRAGVEGMREEPGPECPITTKGRILCRIDRLLAAAKEDE